MTAATVDYNEDLFDDEVGGYEDDLDDLPAFGILEALSRQREWADLALCAQVDPDLFYPEKGGSTKDAKKQCANCPVKYQCLIAALDQKEQFGIWGGLSERERSRLLRGDPDEISLLRGWAESEHEWLNEQARRPVVSVLAQAGVKYSQVLPKLTSMTVTDVTGEDQKMKDRARFAGLVAYLNGQADHAITIPASGHFPLAWELRQAGQVETGPELRRVLGRLERFDTSIESIEIDGRVTFWKFDQVSASPGPSATARPEIIEGQVASAVATDQIVSTHAPTPEIGVVAVLPPRRLKPKLHVVSDIKPKLADKASQPKLSPQQRNAVKNFQGLLAGAKQRGNTAAVSQWQTKIDAIYNDAAADQASA